LPLFGVYSTQRTINGRGGEERRVALVVFFFEGVGEERHSTEEEFIYFFSFPFPNNNNNVPSKIFSNENIEKIK
jgi:hypothetical protein